MPGPSAEQRARLDRALGLLPPRTQRLARWLIATWPGRVGLGTAWNLQRIEIFDRAMAVAAQLFTSVFPTVILLAAWFGDGRQVLTDTLGMPPEAQSEVDAAVKDSGSAAFGLVGTIVVLVSATSLSRALGRAFAAVWGLPKPKSSPAVAWRWLAVVLVLAVSLVLLRRSQTIADGVPPPNVWGQAVALVVLTAVALFVPWVLLSAIVSIRALASGAILFGVVMVLVRPFSNLWLTRSLEASAARYGSIGVAFTYLAWLYLVAWIFLATAVVGQVLVTDSGTIGRRIAGDRPLVDVDRLNRGGITATRSAADDLARMIDDEPIEEQP